MDLDEDVLAMVRRQLDRDPPPPTRALYGRAVRINRDIYELSLRQFHAKYPLRVKRERARREREEAGGAAADASGDAGVDGTALASGGGARDGSAGVDQDAGRRHLFGPEGAGAADGTWRGREVGEGGSPTSAEDAGGVRERVRGVLMGVAREIAEAERPEALVDVVQRIPDRVDELARIVGAAPPRG